tara:strand:- start:1273 stop:1821 length:549 start_codon:yes stop_codon:yes gene_type:complete
LITAKNISIFIDCEKNFFFEKFTDLLIQKNIIVINKKIESFPTLNISFKEKEISINSSLIIRKFSLPMKIDNVISSLFELINNFYFKNSVIQYFPYSKYIKDQNSQKKINLNEIHNIILSNLFLNFDKGLSKEELYYFIWPKDKIYSQNKLDTHLTNLKNILSGLENFKKNFKTEKGIVRLN